MSKTSSSYARPPIHRRRNPMDNPKHNTNRGQQIDKTQSSQEEEEEEVLLDETDQQLQSNTKSGKKLKLQPSVQLSHKQSPDKPVTNCVLLNFFNLFYVKIVLLVVFFIVTVGLCVFYFQRDFEVQPNANAIRNFEISFKIFENHFPSQHNGFRTIKAAVKSILKEEKPLRPAVIALLIQPGAEAVARCLSRRLAYDIRNSLNKMEPVVYFNALDSKKMDVLKFGHVISENITNGLAKGSLVVLIDYFDLIPSENILLFQGFCDDTNAQYKRVVYIFLLNENKGSSLTLPLKDLKITHPWEGKLSEDKLAALESRIGGSKVYVLPEKNFDNSYCHGAL